MRSFGRWPIVLMLVAPFFTVVAGGPSEAMPSALAPIAHRVLLVSIDGLRPDLVLRARAPAIVSLMDRGSFSLWATTTAVAVTLPSHTSMLTGVTPSKHGIDWNTDLPLARPDYPARPTLFELARKAGYTTAMCAGKSKFAALARPGALDVCWVPARGSVTDSSVTDTAVAWIARRAPNLLFVHLPGVDLAGHSQGWGSPAQLEAIAAADRCVERLLAALAARDLLDSTLVLVTSDHGGAGKSHGANDPRSRHIPWIAAGPHVRQNYDLTLDASLAIRTEDTFATLCYVLGIAIERPVEGRPVLQILEPVSAAR